ncbi:hypothetical protein PHMEG_00014809 [Phytophthora megakarya]|uniref:ATP-dependent DNA helicase n=1 Tax=Phytophthora megakarya TaxID=4795 RepID=A0A225W2U6_9STRA|nr:hypothetical protein PHMEG_00014809 [Phytophthora megakarya]
MKSKFSRVVLVIIDEISITDQGLLGGMDAVLRSMSKTPNKYMGGKHVILIGDFLQLLPVAGSPYKEYNLTDQIPMMLLFYVGMPVMVTHKHPELLGADIIANGAIATIVGTYPPLDEMPEIIYETGNIVIRCHDSLVEGFPEGVIGLPALKGRVSLKQIRNLARSSITVTQFALVPAFTCTIEKLQGQTCHDSVVVTPLDNRQTVTSSVS